VELSWSTFVLEIINFLVLVWILKRFLYKPVLGVIARRRAAIDKQIADAEQVRAEADGLRKRYETRVADWNEERARAEAELENEIDEKRTQRLAELERSLEQERAKAEIAARRREADTARRLEDRALAQSAKFAARLLEPLAGPEMHARLLELLARELDSLPAERARTLREEIPADAPIAVTSALPLDGEARERLAASLEAVLGSARPITFATDSGLVAGASLRAGAWVLGLSLREELEGFARLVPNDD
jgi:F-type H+-transporting ATPase subunit b